MDKMKKFFRVSAEDFKKIPGSPIAYWVSRNVAELFVFPKIEDVSFPRRTLQPGDMPRFTRFWFEISIVKSSFPISNKNSAKWIAMSSGGEMRKWYGNLDSVVNWENNGQEIKTSGKAIIPSEDKYFQEAIGWSRISSGKIMMRYYPKKLLHTDATGCIFFKEMNLYAICAYYNSPIATSLLTIINPTITFTRGAIASAPISQAINYQENAELSKRAINLAKSDWDSYETSWDFQTNPLLTVGNGLNASGNQYDLSAIYIALRRDWQRQTEEMRRLEIENNRIFIDAYGLQDELSPEVPWNEITLTCNPWYRYGKNIENFDGVCNDFVLAKKERIEILPVNNNESYERPADAFPFAKETEERLLEDTIKEYISYAVGCMMGRYSPEKPGLILANQPISGQDDEIEYQTAITGSNIFGELGATRYFTIKNGKRKITSYPDFYDVFGDEGNYHQFMDRDGVLPILDEEWFLDDIVAQFKAFLQFTFGAEHFADNLDFIEKALGKDIRKYFIKDFYKDHVQRYKKRPIYWMFSSPKGSFNALIYMHRYRPDTVSIVLNEYLREFISKIRSHREHLITENNRATLAPAEKTRNLKLIDKYAAMLTELDAYERDILYPLAQQKIAIDLDDGVKVNYCKFGAALKKIPGLEAKEE